MSAPVRALRLRVGLMALSLVSLVGFAGVAMANAPGASPAKNASYSLWPNSFVPKVTAEKDSATVTLGVQFRPSTSGWISSIRYYKSPQNAGTHVGKLWTASGTLLSTTQFRNESRSGWQTSSLPKPIRVAAGSVYVASYLAPVGRYADDQNALTSARQKTTGPLTALKGVYAYGRGTAVPRSSWNGSNYYVDVVFTPDRKPPVPGPRPTTAKPTSKPTTTVKPTPPPATTVPSTPPAPTTSTTPPTPAPGGPRLTLTAVDGGPNYYGRWSSNNLSSSPGFFPVGVWEEQGQNSAKLLGHGFNMIVNPVSGGGTGIANVGALEDEADMWAGPGFSAWTGRYPGQRDICSPASAQCGFTVMQSYQASVQPGTMRYANYGKGVAFWDSDAEAAQFVNTYQDVTSADLYWGTDPDLCQASQGGQILGTGRTLSTADCTKASNYGATVDRLRALVNPQGSKPVWNYVELGHPGTSGGTMPVPEIKAAVWSSLIHGARGIVYFNHSFGGSCQSQHVIDDCDASIAAAVGPLNAQIKTLAPVLNSPSVSGTLKTGSIDQLTKWDGKNLYVFTGSTTNGPATAGYVQIGCVGAATATVIGENRSVPVSPSGTISDEWANSNTVHLYRIDGGSTCGLA